MVAAKKKHTASSRIYLKISFENKLKIKKKESYEEGYKCSNCAMKP
jgi:hypothetical protein